MRDLAAGKKKIIRSDSVKVLAIPQYEGLKVECLLEFTKYYPDVMKALPIDKEIKKLSRQYLGNVIYTVVGKPFSDWVDSRVEARNLKVKEGHDMMIDMDPDIAQIFAQSTSVSLQKGKSSSLMKPTAKRRRTKQEIKD